MEPILSKNGIMIPHMGIVGASFAALLTIMTMNPIPELAIGAANNFSIGIPISVATLFFPNIENYKLPFKIAFTIANVALIYIGVISCLLGLHKCFKLISEQAGDNFTIIVLSIFLFLLVWSTYDYFIKPMIKQEKSDDNT